MGVKRVQIPSGAPRLSGSACLLRAGRSSRRDPGNEKPAFLKVFMVFDKGFSGEKNRMRKNQRSRGPDNGARWQSGSERRLTMGQTRHLGEGMPRPSFEETGQCWVAPIRESRTYSKTIECGTTEQQRRAALCVRGREPDSQRTPRGEKTGNLCGCWHMAAN